MTEGHVTKSCLSTTTKLVQPEDQTNYKSKELSLQRSRSKFQHKSSLSVRKDATVQKLHEAGVRTEIADVRSYMNQFERTKA